MKTSIRLTAFAAFLCAGGALAQQPAAAPAAELVLVTGSVQATSAGGTRALGMGDTVAEGEAIVTGQNSYANLKFRDGGRVVLRPDTEFVVESYRYAEPLAGQPATPASGGQQAFFRLVRGGFRAITGLIGRGAKQDYKVTTPVATIGIRGTDYEAMLCDADCPATAAPGRAGEPTQAAGGAGTPGVIVAVNQGGVLVNTPRGTFQVDVGQFLLALQGGQAYVLAVPPDAMLVNPTPSPEACQ